MQESSERVTVKRELLQSIFEVEVQPNRRRSSAADQRRLRRLLSDCSPYVREDLERFIAIADKNAQLKQLSSYINRRYRFHQASLDYLASAARCSDIPSERAAVEQALSLIETVALKEITVGVSERLSDVLDSLEPDPPRREVSEGVVFSGSAEEEVHETQSQAESNADAIEPVNPEEAEGEAAESDS